MSLQQQFELSLIDNFPVQVQVSLFSNGSEYTAYMSANQGIFHSFNIDLKPHDIEELNSELQFEIERVSESFVSDAINDNLIMRLAHKGNYAFNKIFAEGVPREIICKALKTSATIQIVSKDFLIPWELLYNGPIGKQVDISCFWGMQHIVSRSLIQDARPGDLVSPIIPASCPCIGLIACDELEYVVRKEIPALQKLHDKKQILLLLLRPLNADKHFEELEYLSHFLREEELQIVHLACHAFEQTPSSQSFLRVSDKFDITIEDFGVQEFAPKHNPFVILNACLTGIISPLYTSNWAALFWKRGARGVLATEFHIPDSFAAAFTEELYKSFLSGKPIGETLLATRRHFWKKRSNPLGLAYALYSSPSVQILNSK